MARRAEIRRWSTRPGGRCDMQRLAFWMFSARVLGVRAQRACTCREYFEGLLIEGTRDSNVRLCGDDALRSLPDRVAPCREVQRTSPLESETVDGNEPIATPVACTPPPSFH